MKCRCPRGMLALLLAGFWAAPSATAQEVGTKVYLSGMKSTVQVIVPIGDGRAAMGSGSLINLQHGYVLTNWHVVRSAKGEVAVVFPLWEKGRPVVEPDKYEKSIGKVACRGKVLDSDEQCDLALIKLLEPAKIPKGTTSVKFAADSPLAGAKIYSIGNP